MAGLRISQEKNVSGWQVLGVTGAVPPSSVWNSAVFVDKNSLCRSARRISRELRGSPNAGRVLVDENNLFRLAVHISRELRGGPKAGRIFVDKNFFFGRQCVFLENGVGCLWNLRISRGCLWNSHAGVITWVGCLRVDEGVAALVGLEFRRFCRQK